MKTILRGLAIFVLLFACSNVVVAQTTTTVADTIHGPSGTLLSGTITITNNATFTAADGTVVPKGTIATVTVTNGAFSVGLIPNVGSNPTGSSYNAIYQLGGIYLTETWVVPSTPNPSNLLNVRTAAPPSPNVILSASQMPALTGDTISNAGSTVTTTQKVNGVAYSSNPSIDTLPLITATNAATYTVLPSCTDTGGNHLNYSTSTHTFSCGNSGGGSGSQHQVNGTNLAANTPINLENSTATNGLTLTFSNPSAGNVQLGLTGTLTDTGLATAYSGVGACGANNWIFSLSRAGAPNCSQPGFANLSGSATAAQLPATINASAIQDKGGQIYNVKAYGAAGNGVFLYNCSITTGTAALTCTAGAFSAGDVGKLIEVDGAAASSGRLLTTISAVTDATHLTLAVNAGTTTSTANVVYGTDDGPEIQALITMLSTSGGGTMFFPKGIYIINNASDANGFILDIPFVAGPLGQTVNYKFEGPTNMGMVSTTTGVNISGALLYDMSAAVSGFVGASSVSPSFPKSDVYIIVDKMGIITPPTQNYAALHFQLAYDADVLNSLVSPNYGPKATNNIPTYGSTANYGIRLSDQGNGGTSSVQNSAVAGYYTGVLGADHCLILRSIFQNNKYAIKNIARFYGMTVLEISIQNSTVGIVNDLNNILWGTAVFETNATDVGIDTGTEMGTGFLWLADSSGSPRVDTAHMNPGFFWVDGNNGVLNSSITFASYTFATLPTEVNGLQVYCSDCKNVGTDAVTFDSVAVGAGTGTTVLGENGAWRVH